MKRSEWATEFLALCGFPVTPANVNAVIAWAASENTQANCNPLATEEPWEGATDYNPQGVKNYTDTASGLAATKATLFGGPYGPVISAFQISGNTQAITAQICASPWGSQPTPSLTASVISNPTRYDTEVTGTGEPTPAPGPTPTEAPPFPLEPGNWFGLPSPDPHNHSGYFSEADREALRPWQKQAGIMDDGLFGPETYKRVIQVQKAHGVKVDGLIGPITWPLVWP